jgi:2-C-methyl-D-erythritol 4-phosphate cytidylyltransferase
MAWVKFISALILIFRKINKIRDYLCKVMDKRGIIIVAGGVGSRMGNSTPKQFLLLAGRPVLAWTVGTFAKAVPEADIVVALPADYMKQWAELSLTHKVPPHKICEGGANRFESVKRALAMLDESCDYIAVHDGVRPLVSAELIGYTFDVAHKHGTAIPTLVVTDSIRCVTEAGSFPVDRTTLRGVQTPQVFREDILRAGYERAEGSDFTDDATVVESIGYNVMLCTGERCNIKITTPADFTVAEAIIGKR